MDLSFSRPLRTALFALGFTFLGASGAVTMQAQAQGGGGSTIGEIQGPNGQARKKPRRANTHGILGQMRMLTAEMDLSEDQLGMVKAVGKDFRQSRKAQHEDRLTDLETLRSILDEDKVNRRAVHKVIDERLEEKADSIHETADQLLDFVETLDADQRVILNEKLIEMETRASERAQGKAAPRSPQSWGPPTTEGSAP